MALMELRCQAGNHTWTRESKRGRPPLNCPEHTPAPSAPVMRPNSTQQPTVARSVTDMVPGLSELLHESKMVKLWCEAGQHTYSRESQRGKRPRNCPEHTESIAAAKPRERSTDHQQRVIRAILTSPSAAFCHCGITEHSSPADLRGIVKSCTDPQYVCPTLDKTRRAIGV